MLKSFRLLVDHCGISLSPLQVKFYRNICTTIGFAVVLVFPTLMSANFEISDHGVFSGVKVLAIGYIRRQIIALLKLILKFRTVNF